MKTNISTRTPQFTHEGAPSSPVPPYEALKRSIMACMLWEDNFYEDGQSIVERITDLCLKVKAEKILELALQVHQKGLLRHIPLKLMVELLKKCHKPEGVSDAIANICSRPDQMTELLSIYWKDGRKPLAAHLKKGLAKAFRKFDEYQLAKYNRDDPIKLRDVLFLCHAKPKDEAQADLWKRLVSKTLKTPDTWEVRLSSGADKKQSFEVLLKEGKLGRLATLRNLRNMQQSGVPKELVRSGLMSKSRPLLPFQFIQASKECPQWEDIIDESMIQSLEDKEKLSGMTVVFVDVSGSMTTSTISSKSKATPQDAASSLAILLREICERFDFFSFSNSVAFVAPRRGMALRDAIKNSQPSGGTNLGAALSIYESKRTAVLVDRIIVITDEQSSSVPPKMDIPRKYILNVSNCKNGIKNDGTWMTISGFSEASIDYIREIESSD